MDVPGEGPEVSRGRAPRALAALLLLGGLCACAGKDVRGPAPTEQQDASKNVDAPTARADLRLGQAALRRGLDPADLEDQALPPLRRAIEADPSLAEAWFALGETYALLERHEDAEGAYRAALALRPEQPRWLIALGDLLASGVFPSARAQEAESLYRRAAGSAQGGPFARIGASHVRGGVGDAAEAVSEARQATQEAPEQWRAWDALGQALARADAAQPAVDACEEALRLAPGRPRALLGLARALHQRGEDQGARELINELLLLRPRDRHGLSLCGAIERALGQPARARRSFDRAIAQDPRDPVPFLGRGLTLLDESKPEEAARDLREAARLEPSDDQLARALPRRLSREGKHALGDAFAAHGKALAARGEIVRALGSYDQALRCDGSLSHAYRSATLALALGDSDGSLRRLERGYEVGLRDWRKLRLDEALASLREDPRFTALLRRMGMPEDISDLPVPGADPVGLQVPGAGPARGDAPLQQDASGSRSGSK